MSYAFQEEGNEAENHSHHQHNEDEDDNNNNQYNNQGDDGEQNNNNKQESTNNTNEHENEHNENENNNVNDDDEDKEDDDDNSDDDVNHFKLPQIVSARAQDVAEKNEPLPFDVIKSLDGTVSLPAAAFTPRDNRKEEKRRLKLLELYWDNSNPLLKGLFSSVEPIDRILQRHEEMVNQFSVNNENNGNGNENTSSISPSTTTMNRGGGGGNRNIKTADTISRGTTANNNNNNSYQMEFYATGSHGGGALSKHSLFLKEIPRSNLQKRLDAIPFTQQERHRRKNLRIAARRALKRDSDSDNDHKNKNENDEEEQDEEEDQETPEERQKRLHEEEAERKKTEQELRLQQQEVRKEKLRKRFYRGDVLEEDDFGARRRAMNQLDTTFDVGMYDRRKRAAQQKGRITKEAQAMREQAEARRLGAANRRQHEAEEQKRKKFELKNQRLQESAVDRDRREWLAKQRAERDRLRDAERDKLRKVQEQDEKRSRAKAQQARDLARRQAEEQAKKKEEEERRKVARESEERARREKEEDDELESALTRKKSMSHPEPKYKHAGPTGVDVMSRKVYECLEEGQGQLFRVVETDPNLRGKRWHFYNDTEKTTFHVKIFFEPPCSVRSLGDANMEQDEFTGERGEVVISIKVPPLETLAFSEGKVKAFSAEIESEDMLSASGQFSQEGSLSRYTDDQEGQVPLQIPLYKHGAPEGIEAPYEVYECFEGSGILFRIVKRNPDGTQNWWYYNDDDQFGMKIEVKFGAPSEITAMDPPAKKYNVPETGQHRVCASVDCLKTIPFIHGRVHGFTQDFDIIEPEYGADGEEGKEGDGADATGGNLSPSPSRINVDRRKSMSGKERRKYVKQLQERATDMVEQVRKFALDQNILPDMVAEGGSEEVDEETGEKKKTEYSVSKAQDILLACLKKKHFFMDLRFPPLLPSISTDEDQQEALNDICWMKAEDFLPHPGQPGYINPNPASSTSGGKTGDSPPSINAAAAVASSKSAKLNPQQQKEKEKEKELQNLPPMKAVPVVATGAGGTGGANPGDIQAGAISDWWILSALAVIAQSPGRIASLFKHHPQGPAVERKEMSQGIYRVRMLVGGWWHDVVVDDWLPVEIDSKGRPSLFFATSKKGPHELWPCLIEKAYAKTSADKCFTELGNGDSLHVIEDLTGFPSVRLDPRLEEEADSEDEHLFEDVKSYLERDWIVVFNTSQMPDDDDEAEKLEKQLGKAGLQMDCVYKVIDAKDFTHLGITHRMLKFVDPWSNGTKWKGAWSWGSSDWKRIPSAGRICEIPGAAPATSRRNSSFSKPPKTEQQNQQDSSSNVMEGITISIGGADDDSSSTAIPKIVAPTPPKEPKNSTSSKNKRTNSDVAAIKKEKVKDSPEDGSFWMEWKDAKRFFTGAGVCYTQHNWHDYRVRGTFTDGHPNIALEVRCSQTTRAFVLLMQEPEYGFDHENPEAKYAGALLSIASRRADSESGDYDVVLNSDLYFDKPSKELTFVMGRSLGAEFTFEGNEEDVHLIIPRCFSKTANKQYVLAVISDNPVGDETISFRFREMNNELGIFDNQSTFTYLRSRHSEDVVAEFSYRPPFGRPQLNEGNEFEGAPSDLMNTRGSGRLGGGGMTPLPGIYASESSPSPSAGEFSAEASLGALLGNSSFRGKQNKQQGGAGGLLAPEQSMGARPQSSMSFEILSDVLVQVRSCTTLPFEVNSLGIYDFKGQEVYVSPRKLIPASNTPNWIGENIPSTSTATTGETTATATTTEPTLFAIPTVSATTMPERLPLGNSTIAAGHPVGEPLSYLWNSEHRNLTFRLLYVDDETGETTVMCEGKSSWEDATVAAKLANEKGGRRPVVALRLRTPKVSDGMRKSATGANLFSESKGRGGEVVGSLSIMFHNVSPTTVTNEAAYFKINCDMASRITVDGDETRTHLVLMTNNHTASNKNNEPSPSSLNASVGNLSISSAMSSPQVSDSLNNTLTSNVNRAVWISSESTPATMKMVMFCGGGSECVVQNHRGGNGFIIRLANIDTGKIYGEKELTPQLLTENSSIPEGVQIDLIPKCEGVEEVFVKMRIVAFRSENDY